jgi:hypothetical protein
VRDGKIEVRIWLNQESSATVEQLRALGFELATSSGGKTLTARSPVDNWKLAQISEVSSSHRRDEPPCADKYRRDLQPHEGRFCGRCFQSLINCYLQLLSCPSADRFFPQLSSTLAFSAQEREPSSSRLKRGTE